MHKRTSIRNALVALLTGTGPSYATSAGAKVYSNRAKKTNGLPNIKIHDEQETAQPRDIRSSNYIKKITMNIEITVAGREDYDTTLDNLAQQVEDLMASDRTLGGTASGVIYTGTDLNFEDGGDDGTTGKATLTYEITYLT